MSAIDDALDFVEDNNTIGSGVSVSAARIDIAAIRAAASEADALRAELDKWRTWKPDDEDLKSLAQQAMKRDGSHSDSLAACWAYIRGLEAWLREHDALRAERDELKAALELGQVNCDAEYDDLRQQLSNECLIAVKLRSTVAEQARQIEALELSVENGTAIVRSNISARDALESIQIHTDPNGADGTYRFDSSDDACDFCFALATAWLAANAPTPAPEAEQERAS